jgi:hypothetical protein
VAVDLCTGVCGVRWTGVAGDGTGKHTHTEAEDLAHAWLLDCYGQSVRLLQLATCPKSRLLDSRRDCPERGGEHPHRTLHTALGHHPQHGHIAAAPARLPSTCRTPHLPCCLSTTHSALQAAWHPPSSLV